jgi:hypothetical protein
MLVRRICTVAVAVAVLGLATAGVAAAMTATVGEPNLIGRVALTVPVTVTCDAPSPGLAVASQSVSVLVEQASGKGIARGTANLFNFFPAQLFPCDGTATTLTASVLADPNGPPFHGGKVVVRATVRAEAGVPFPCCPGSFMGPFETQVADTGPVLVKLG